MEVTVQIKGTEFGVQKQAFTFMVSLLLTMSLKQFSGGGTALLDDLRHETAGYPQAAR